MSERVGWGGGLRWGGADDKAKKRKTGQHLNVHLRDCPRAEECPHEFVEVSTQESLLLHYITEKSILIMIDPRPTVVPGELGLLSLQS